MEARTMIRVNLISNEQRAAQVRHRHLRRWAVASVAAALLVVGPLGMDWVHRAQAKELGEYSQHLHDEFARVRTDSQSLNAEAEYAELQLSRAKALRSKRSWSGMLALVASCTPEQAWLTSVATDPVSPASGAGKVLAGTKGEKPSGDVALDAPRRLVLLGYALDATLPNRFVTNLKETGVFPDVVLVRSTIQSILDGDYHSFEIICEW
jgi:hypothetical protein